MADEPAVVVFAYHDVGYVCLEELLRRGARVVALITHEDDPKENRWFRSVAELAEKHGIPVYKPASVNNEEWLTRSARVAARDYLFVLLPPSHPRDHSEALTPGCVQPARFAAAKIPWARANQLGDYSRRNPNRRDTASYGGQAGRRRYRRSGGRTDRADGNRARGVRQGRAPRRARSLRASGTTSSLARPRACRRTRRRPATMAGANPKTAASTGAWAPGRFSTSCVPSPTRTRARLRNSTDAGFLSGGRCHDAKPRPRLILRQDERAKRTGLRTGARPSPRSSRRRRRTAGRGGLDHAAARCYRAGQSRSVAVTMGGRGGAGCRDRGSQTWPSARYSTKIIKRFGRSCASRGPRLLPLGEK